MRPRPSQDDHRDGPRSAVLVIKVADRLHNMRTASGHPRRRPQKKARETRDLAPAHRLGMNTVKWELEDLSFAIASSRRCYEEIVRLVVRRRRATHLSGEFAPRSPGAEGQKIRAAVERTPEALLVDLSEDDRQGPRLPTSSTTWSACTDSLRRDSRLLPRRVPASLHALWQPDAWAVQGLHRQPRFGVYQSLHTTVVGPEGKPLEVQIRTQRHAPAPPNTASRPTGDIKQSRSTDYRTARRRMQTVADSGRPGRVPDSRCVTNSQWELFVHPKGDVITPFAGSTRRLRVRRAHRGGGIAVSARGSTAGWSPWNA